MYAVGRFITQGVSTVSGPFHPFGGAIDIVVVKQQDGSLKSSPWYVRFGKFQGVLKATERVVDIKVNGIKADFQMYLSPKGEAYFLVEDLGSDSKRSNYNIDGNNSNSDTKSAEIAADLLERKWSTNDKKTEKIKKDDKIEITGGKLEASLVLQEDHFVHKSKDNKTTNDTAKEVDKNSISNKEKEAKKAEQKQEKVSKETKDDKCTESCPKSNGQLQFGSDPFPCTIDHVSIKDDVEVVPGNIRKFLSDSDLIKSYKLMEAEEEEIVHKSKSMPNLWSSFNEFELDKVDASSYFLNDPKRILLKWDLLRKDAARIMQQQSYADTNANNGDESGKSWSLWPFSRSKRTDNISKPIKWKREVTPTPKQLESLKLTKGKNTVTFTFSTAVLGNQQVDARIFLWKWDTHIAISDVDGTITKSDVLGQFMPLVGKDWTHIGVAPLFSAIKENGYEIIFLSARSISQADITRHFLINLKQEGKTLPEGPVVISPDGLFPSLFREVIRRAPHEFKIACLEDIRVCFPSEWNPFYAGFGNRDTDEFSYVKVGISKEKIFIINPKGEVVVNHCKEMQSYTSLHSNVNDIFPPKSVEQPNKVVDS